MLLPADDVLARLALLFSSRRICLCAFSLYTNEAGVVTDDVAVSDLASYFKLTQVRLLALMLMGC